LAALAIRLITKRAKTDGITVMLSGDGGDELFLGYPTYRWVETLGYAYRLPDPVRYAVATIANLSAQAFGKSRLAKAAIALRQDSLTRGAYYLTSHGAWTVEELRHIRRVNTLTVPQESFISAFKGNNGNRRIMYHHADALFAGYLPDNTLARMDLASMASSVEARAPFLNPRLAEFASRLPLEMMIRGAEHKYILRRALAGVLPSEIVERPKHGFDPIPMAKWLRTDLAFLIYKYLAPKQLEAHGLLDVSYVAQIVREHQQGGVHNHWWKLWLLIVLQMYLNYWTGQIRPTVCHTDVKDVVQRFQLFTSSEGTQAIQ
jgi:asparagine synthase (glutamine-hydrolysing)